MHFHHDGKRIRKRESEREREMMKEELKLGGQAHIFHVMGRC
jgi:hypothetical protein